MISQVQTNLDARGCILNDVDGDQIINNATHYHADHAACILDILAKFNVPEAAYNSCQREHAPSCLPDTRTAVLQEISNWIDGEDNHPIYYLTGPAGSGKSTIAQTVANHCASNEVLVGTIFFSHAESLRISTSRFFLTLAYQLAVFVPSIQASMQKLFEEDPSFATKRLEDHFMGLIYEPILTLKQPVPPMIIIVDALDESEDAVGVVKLLRIITGALQDDLFPLRFFFTSRLEHHIETQFSKSTTRRITTYLALEKWEVHSDIRVFLELHLQRIRDEKHRIMANLPEFWPSITDLNHLVSKSEGSFIWASTLVKFVDDGLPHEKLRSALNTHAGLDPLYHQVLSFPRGVNFRQLIGKILLLRTPLSIESLQDLINLRSDEILELLQGLKSILVIPEHDHGVIRPFHGSMRDFLISRSRSQDLFIDPAVIHFALVRDCIAVIQSCLEKDTVANQVVVYACESWCYHLNLALTHGGDGFAPESETCLSLVNCLRAISDQPECWIANMGRGNQWQIMQELRSALVKLKQNMNFTSHRYLNSVVSEPNLRQYNLILILEDLERLIDNNVLAALKPAADERRRYVVPECMEGTRRALFEEISSWVNDFDAPNVLWISGRPGSGKSAIASSLVSELTKLRRLASHFFCKRDYLRLGDPAVLWRTVASDLAGFNPAVKASLLELLKKADFKDTDILLHFHCFIAAPLTKNSNHSSAPPPVVVLDGLDECGSDESQFAQRSILLNTIAMWSSHVPLSCKLIVTSRGGCVPISLQNHQLCRHVVLETGNRINHTTADDIRIFFEKSFAYLARELDLPTIWPGIPKKMQLTERAAGLFIWAKTAIAFIAENQGNPETKLRLILEGELGRGRENLDSLYRQILYFAFTGVDDTMLELYRAVVGTIIVAKEPLHRKDLKYYIGREDPEDDRQIGIILHKLTSVISEGDDGLLYINHLSFVEFLSDVNRCHEFAIDQSQHRQNFALVCLRLMNRMLKFNICGWDTSHGHNDDMKMSTLVPAYLSYSCRFWAEHLGEDGNRHGRLELLKELRHFLYDRFLFWLEVLSLTKEVSIAQLSLLIAIRWLGTSDKGLSAFAKDARRFVVCFQIPIAESAPHIYLSALPFAPKKSKVSKHFLPRFPGTLSIATGQGDRWPAILNILTGHTGHVMSASFSPDNRLVVSSSADKTIYIWDAETGLAILGPFKGHTDYIRTVAFSPDGKRVVSGSDDTTVCVWDAGTGHLVVGPITGHVGFVRSVRFSPDGKHIVSGSGDGTICIWDAETGGGVSGPFEGHTDYVMSVAFSPDGKHVVSGSVDRTIRIWDANTGQTVLGPLKGHTEYVMSVAFSPDGQCIASGSADNTILIWDVTTGVALLSAFEGHADYVMSVGFSPDGKRIVSGSADKTIRIWDAATGMTVSGPLEGHTDYVRSVAFSLDGKRVVSSSDDKTIRIWDAKAGTTVAGHIESQAHYVRSVAFSPDGRRIVSGSDDEHVRIWDSKTGALVLGPLGGHTDYIRSVAFSPDGKYVVSGADDDTVRVWDAMEGLPLCEPFKGHTGHVLSVAFSPDSNIVVSGSDDKTIRIWDAKTGLSTPSPWEGHTNHVRSVAFSPDGRSVVSGSDDMTVRIWDIETGKMVFDPFEGHTDYVMSVAFSPNGNQVVSGSSDETIRVWAISTGQTISGPFKGHTNDVRSVAFSPDGKWVVSSSADHTIRIWDAVTGQTISGPFIGHKDYVRSVAFSPNGNHVVSGSDDETIRIWDIKTGRTVLGPLEGQTRYVRSVAFSPDGRYVVSGSDDKMIYMWDATTGKELVVGPFKGHTGYVRSVAFSPDGKYLVSGSDDKTIRIWDTNTGLTVSGPFIGHTDYVRSVAFSPDGKTVISGSDDKTVRIWDTQTGKAASDHFKGHTEYVMSVAFSPDGTLVCSGSEDQTICIWSIATGMMSRSFRGHTGHVLSCTFSPDGKNVVSGSADKTIRVWDVVAGELVSGPFEGHTGCVRSVGFSPDGEHVVSGSDDMTIRIWNVATGQIISNPLEGHTNYVMSIAFSPNGKQIVSGSADKTIRIWDAAAGHQISGPLSGDALSVLHPLIESCAVLGSMQNHSQHVKCPTLYCGFVVDHLSGWATSQHSMDMATGSLLFWVPPHNRWGICGEETITIMETPLNRLDFKRFIHGPSWAQCYITPASTTQHPPTSISFNSLLQGQVFVMLMIFGLLLLPLGMLNWLGGV